MEFSSNIIKNSVDTISKLPGIGKKSALRIVLHLIKERKQYTKDLSEAIIKITKDITRCSECYNISDDNICNICISPNRNQEAMCVVESIQDVIFIENTNQYNGLYHVLGGLISPINGIGAEKLNIETLLDRLKNKGVKEVLFAFSATFDGDTTSFYLNKLIKPLNIQISTLSKGVPIGSELEYTDEITLGRSIISRIPFN